MTKSNMRRLSLAASVLALALSGATGAALASHGADDPPGHHHHHHHHHHGPHYR
jgi:Spy/CpxP family protein refolding chaperone